MNRLETINVRMDGLDRLENAKNVNVDWTGVFVNSVMKKKENADAKMAGI